MTSNSSITQASLELFFHSVSSGELFIYSDANYIISADILTFEYIHGVFTVVFVVFTSMVNSYGHEQICKQ